MGHTRSDSITRVHSRSPASAAQLIEELSHGLRDQRSPSQAVLTATNDFGKPHSRSVTISDVGK